MVTQERRGINARYSTFQGPLLCFHLPKKLREARGDARLFRKIKKGDGFFEAYHQDVSKGSKLQTEEDVDSFFLVYSSTTSHKTNVGLTQGNSTIQGTGLFICREYKKDRIVIASSLTLRELALRVR